MIIHFSSNFRRRYKHLATSQKKQTDEIMIDLQECSDWSVYGDHPLTKSFEGFYSLSIDDDLRAIYKQVKGGVLFVEIGTHEDLYG